MPPKKLRILGKVYKVTCGGEELPGTEAIGTCDYTNCQIQWATRQDAQQLRDTLIHEALHAIDYVVQAKLTEDQVHAIASGFYALMADNPAFVAWVMDRR